MIYQIIKNDMGFNPEISTHQDVGSALSSLFQNLKEKKIDYVLVGGVALQAYIDGRNTQDIDIIINQDQLGLISWNPIIQDENFGRAEYHGIRVDFLFLSNPLFRHVFEHEKEENVNLFGGIYIPTATPVGLLLLKLYALPSLYRNMQLERAALYEADIRMLLLLYGEEKWTVALRTLVFLKDHLISSDITELARIIGEQSQRNFT